MLFIMCWFAASLIVFANRYQGVELDFSFYLGVAFTGLLWALGIGIVLVLLWFIATCSLVYYNDE